VSEGVAGTEIGVGGLSATRRFLPLDLVRAGLVRLALARGALLPWAPVFFATGIGLYFALHREPSGLVLALVASGFLGALAVAWRGRDDLGPVALAVAFLAGGFLIAVLRAHLVAAPVLPYRYFGPVEGRVVDTDRSFSDQPRLTLDRVTLKDVAPDEMPVRVRVALHGFQGADLPPPGALVRLTANLSPPDGPVEPGGFDFQRLAWFSSLGAVGYSRAPVIILEPPQGGFALMAFRLRLALSHGMQAHMSGQAGAFAAALMTGDRSGVSSATNASLRGSNLSHMISISGLHMSLLMGFVFALCRYGLALVPPVALRIDTRKAAAGIALAAITFYMILAGPDVAVRRSYIQAAVILLAVLLDRRALSLRSVALAALVCLALEPESLVEPGFQMSFGATAALIVGFGYWQTVQHHVPALIRPLVIMVLSSLIAGSATGPIAAAHFNRVAEYGLLANLIAVPIMGLLVMPAGVIAAIAAPFGLAALPLWAMERGAALILAASDWVAGLNGAVIPVPAPPDGVLPLFGLAGAVLLIGRGLILRGVGAAGLFAALVLWSAATRPDLLIAADGGLAGIMTPAGRALSKEKGGGFVAQSWLENDGDLADQPAAFARSGFSGPKGDVVTKIAGWPVRVLSGKGAALRAPAACTAGAIVILAVRWEGAAPVGCLFLDQRQLRRTGALAITLGPDGLVAVSAREWAGKRLWNWRPRRKWVGDTSSGSQTAATGPQAGAMKGWDTR